MVANATMTVSSKLKNSVWDSVDSGIWRALARYCTRYEGSRYTLPASRRVISPPEMSTSTLRDDADVSLLPSRLSNLPSRNGDS